MKDRKKIFLKTLNENLQEKSRESLVAVFPVLLLVLFNGLFIIPINNGLLLQFVFGSLLVMLGMIFFNLGAEKSMSHIGELVGSSLVKTKKIGLIIPIIFLLGFMITISEPDLQVLAHQVTSIPNSILIATVAIGVGFFLALAILRILFGWSLSKMLIGLYVIVLILSAFIPKSFLSVAFDSGGVTTGPMTVPFIMALGLGISSVRSDNKAEDDSFGLVALCSIGPILMVMILSLFFSGDLNVSIEKSLYPMDTYELKTIFLHAFPTYMKEIGVALLPIVVFFEIYNFIFLKVSKETHIKIGMGLLYTYIGLFLFMCGANVGFVSMGNYIGSMLPSYLIIPFGMIIGFLIVRVEPAVAILTKQVEQITEGAISERVMLFSLSVGVSLAIGLSLTRIIFDFSIMYIMVPGLLIALVLTFFVPNIFTAIAFDSGGVASGPMTATFLLPLAQGACILQGKDIALYGFGVVALVALAPLITIQLLGLIYKFKQSHVKSEVFENKILEMFENYDDKDIIEF